MLSQRIEGRVLAVVERVVGGGVIEDSLVECKAEWPPAARAARRIAGHANAARGEPILWVVGLDEKGHQVTGAGEVELADWWAEVSSKFDEQVVPGLTSLVVPVGEGRAVVGLYMTTDRAPYVVKRQGDHGPCEREVPWRDGTRVRSAYRHELFKLLVPPVLMPEATVVTLSVQALHQAARLSRPEHVQGPGKVAIRPYLSDGFT